jgi:ABC-2 type transport system ATP-binding protein
VLTTHYLEEAETLCSRIAMLKQGQVIALDTTHNLLSAHAATLVSLKLDPHRLPDALRPLLVAEEAGCFRLVLNDYSGLEKVLATLREENVAVDELEVSKPDLEDVFLQIMGRAGKVVAR